MHRSACLARGAATLTLASEFFQVPHAQEKTSLESSYRHCATMARRSASNFWYAFYLLPRDKRRAMFALYAFLRRTDDLGDSEEPIVARRDAIQLWRAQLTAAIDGAACDPVFPALMDTVNRYQIPLDLLTDAIDGVESDLDRRSFETFVELKHYCYQVASTVGLACVQIWGYTSDAAFAPAKACGVAFQLTNILRDLGEDARRNRMYLPAEDLHRFGFTADDVLRDTHAARFRELLDFEIERAEAAYTEAAELLNFLTRDGRRVYSAMFAIYRGLLTKIHSQGPMAVARRVRLSRFEKLRILAHSLLAPESLVAAATPPALPIGHDRTQARA